MRKTFRNILAILDGRPTETKGQSMVELSLTMPIFLVMLLGVVEVGWYANNYLILSDVVRAAGRYGSLRDPLDWTPGNERRYHYLDCDAFETRPDADVAYGTPTERDITLGQVQMEVADPVYFSTVGSESASLGYYDGVACSALANMAPLEFNREVDDIVVSVFSYARFDGGDPCGGAGPCVRVTGRYPANQNECSNDSRDPFDIDDDGVVDDGTQGGTPQERSVAGVYFDASSNEGYRGYVFRGHAVDPDNPNCRGSHFTVDWMQEQLERSLVLEDTEGTRMELDEFSAMPNYGLVLVEMTWESNQLLGFPLLTAVGDPIGVHIWGVFPVSAAEPDIED